MQNLVAMAYSSLAQYLSQLRGVSHINIRAAVKADLERIVSLLAQDSLGQTREDASAPLDQRYLDAFRAIELDPNQMLVVAVDDDVIVGTLQLSFIPNISRLGSWRMQVEGVRIDERVRGRGAGEQMLEWSISQARQRNCTLVQLTCDCTRLDARRFYERLGFVASHVGLKLTL